MVKQSGYRLGTLFWLALVLTACGAPEQPAPAAPLPALNEPSAEPESPDFEEGAEVEQPPKAECTALGCQLFDTATEALAFILKTDPLVLGVGEAHALKGSEGIESTTSRFTNQLLPVLADRASDIVLELMEPDPSCLKATEEVRKEQRQVTKEQATGNQNEFVTLGTRSKEAGVTPHILYPDCVQYERILQAGDDSIFVMLETIATLTEEKAKAILLRNRKRGAERLVVLYGGAVHNDLAPREGRGAWSYGPAMAAHTDGRYVELDLIVREYIKDTDVWRSLPWYLHFDKQAHPGQVVLFQPTPGAYVMIFPAAP